jgi:hypothetical protein
MHRSSPGFAFFIRNADGVVLENVTVAKLKPDARPWFSRVNATVETPGCTEATPKDAPANTAGLGLR